MMRKVIREQVHHLPRQYYCGRICATFTVCVQHKQPLFARDTIVAEFVSILDWARKRNGCVVMLYCFMPDHLHLIVQGQNDQADLYKTMLDLKYKAGLYLSQSRAHHRLQKNFYDHIIRGENELASHLTYVAENPIRRGLVSRWQDYRFTGSLGIDFLSIMDAML